MSIRTELRNALVYLVSLPGRVVMAMQQEKHLNPPRYAMGGIQAPTSEMGAPIALNRGEKWIQLEPKPDPFGIPSRQIMHMCLGEFVVNLEQLQEMPRADLEYLLKRDPPSGYRRDIKHTGREIRAIVQRRVLTNRINPPNTEKDEQA